MKIGDKVRFLNEVGGGVVSGFQDKETVLVRDEDGFDVPVLARECVVVETDNYNLAHPSVAGSRQADNRFRTQQPDTYVRSFDDEEDRKPVTFKPKPLERRGADVLNLFLAFVPVDARELTNTAFEAYLVNDSNYFVRFALTTQTGAAVQLRHEGLVEPPARRQADFPLDGLIPNGRGDQQIFTRRRIQGKMAFLVGNGTDCRSFQIDGRQINNLPLLRQDSSCYSTTSISHQRQSAHQTNQEINNLTQSHLTRSIFYIIN